MWSRARKPILGISIGPTKIICSILEPSNNRFIIKTFEQLIVELPLVKNLTIFNFTKLNYHVQTFFKNSHLKDCYAVISLVHPGIVERIISLSVETPQHHHLQQDQNPKQLVWDYHSLGYNRNKSKTHYYLCGITREQLFHYELFSLFSGIHCIGIVPQRVALLKASIMLYPNNPELSTIANHAALQNYLDYSIEKIKPEHLFCTTPNEIDKHALFESLGLFFVGNEIYERY